MDNYVDNGTTVNYTNGGGSVIASGSAIKMGHSIGVALTDIAVGATGAVQVAGKVTVPKVAAAVFAVGEKLIWVAAAAAFDDSLAVAAAGDITGAAVAAVAGAAGQTTCTVILCPGNATLT